MRLCGILFPKFVLDGLVTGASVNYFLVVIIAFLCTFVPLAVAREYIESVYDPKITFIRFQFLALYYKKCMSMKYEYTESPEMLDKVEESCAAVGASNKGLANYIKQSIDIVVCIFSLCIYFAMIVKLEKWVFLILLFSAVILYCLQSYANNYAYQKEKEKANINRKVSYLRYVMCKDTFGKDIRLFNMGEWLCGIQRKNIAEYIFLIKKILLRFKVSSLMNAALGVLREGVIYMYLIKEVLEHNLSIGNFTMYLSLFFSFSNILSDFTKNMANMKGENLIINHFRGFLEFEEEYCGTNIERNRKGETCPEIKLENVSFCYPNTNKYILRNIDLTIHAGEKIAIVGENGEGKSTLIKLICNLYEPTKGEIYFNDTNIKDIPKEIYYEQLAVIFQEVNILEFSIAENIAMCSEQLIDSACLKKAIEISDLEEKMNQLQKREKTFLGKSIDVDGIALSGGESQKLMMARAYYKNSGLIILDEPTAALDPIAEKNIYEKFHKITADRTAVFISHRLSSTKFCDRIIVVADGNILEEGTHEELMTANGYYAKLFYTQAQYYL